MVVICYLAKNSWWFRKEGEGGWVGISEPPFILKTS
jgi:hypothetical protein